MGDLAYVAKEHRAADLEHAAFTPQPVKGKPLASRLAEKSPIVFSIENPGGVDGVLGGVVGGVVGGADADAPPAAAALEALAPAKSRLFITHHNNNKRLSVSIMSIKMTDKLWAFDRASAGPAEPCAHTCDQDVQDAHHPKVHFNALRSSLMGKARRCNPIVSPNLADQAGKLFVLADAADLCVSHRILPYCC